MTTEHGSLETQTISIKTLWTIAGALLFGAVTVGGVMVSVKLEVADTGSEVRHLKEQVTSIAAKLEGADDVRSDMKIMRSDFNRLQLDVEKLKQGPSK